MDEHITLQTIERIHVDNEMVPVVLRYWDILMVFEAATMTLTHPNITEYNKQYYTDLAKTLELRLAEEFPELKPLLKMCWNRQLNMTDDPHTLSNRQARLDNMNARYRRKTGRK